MVRNAVWLVFLILVVFVAIWFFVKAGYDLVHYYKLSTKVPVTVEQWKVEERGNDAYAIVADFNFTFDGKEYRSFGVVGKSYPNPWAAEKSMKKVSKQNLSVWINPAHPEKAVFVKKFPFKTAVSAVILLGLAIYFFCLGFFIGGGKVGTNK